MEKVSRKLLEDIYSNNPWNGYDDVSFITNPEIKPNPNNIIGCELLSHSTSSVISNGCGITFLHGEDTKLDMSYLGKKGCVPDKADVSYIFKSGLYSKKKKYLNKAFIKAVEEERGKQTRKLLSDKLDILNAWINFNSYKSVINEFNRKI